MNVLRDIKSRISYLATKYPAITITGPRQSGKTTLARSVFDGYEYVSMEDSDACRYAHEDPRAFLDRCGPRVILDEVHRAPDLLHDIQVRIDEHDEPGMYILTSSQHFLLSHAISQSLAGRTALCTLLPFSAAELTAAGICPESVDELILHGGYPRLWAQSMGPVDFFPSYIATYVERDLRQIKLIADLALFERFLRLCAGRVGGLLNLASLAGDCGISHTTAQQWLSLLQTSYIAYLLPPHFTNFNKRLVRSHKLYFYDTGLVCSLLGIRTTSHLETHPLRGALFETFIMGELVKSRYNAVHPLDLYFWRDKNGHEVDCVVDMAGRLVPVEIKSGRMVPGDAFDGLSYFQALAGERAGFLVYGGDESHQRSTAAVLGWRDAARVFTDYLPPQNSPPVAVAEVREEYRRHMPRKRGRSGHRTVRKKKQESNSV